MSLRLQHLAPLALLPLGLAATPRGDRIAFDVQEGLVLEKTFESEFSIEMADLAVSFGGQEIDPSMMGDPQVDLSLSGAVTVIDEYGPTADGRPTRVARTFDSAAMQMDMAASSGDGDEESSQSAASELEGETVVFTWSDDEEAYLKAFEDGGDEDLLEGLEEDMDYRALLPAGEVEAEDTWEIDPEVLGQILMPGGDLALESEESGDGDEVPEEVMDAIEEVFLDLFAGSTTATYRGTRDEGGVEVAVIDVRMEVDSSADVSEVLISAIEASGEDAGADFERVDVSLTFDGEGVLLWNLKAGHFHAFELSGDVLLALDLALSSEEMGGASLEASVEFEGSASFSSAVGG